MSEAIREEYRAILEGYLSGGGEAAMLQAYEFARRCLRDGLAPDDVMALHVELVDDRLQERFGPDVASRAQTMLLEIVVAFSMSYRQMVEELERANKQLETNSRFKSRMLSMVAHDLTNHNTAIKLMTRACLKDAMHPPVQKRLQHVLSVIEDEEHLIRNLLDISRIESGKLQVNVEPVVLSEVIARSVERVRTNTTVHAFSICVPNVPVAADRAKIQQVVENLLANAVKYSPEGGPVEIAGEVTADKLMISIRDRGLGIAPEDLPHLFEPFFRGHGAERTQISGTGLGLAIVKSLITLQHGTVEVESTPGEGSTFRFALPLASRASLRTDVPSALGF